MTTTLIDVDVVTVNLALAVDMPSVAVGVPAVPGLPEHVAAADPHPGYLTPADLDIVTVHASGGDDLAALQAAVAGAVRGVRIVLPDALYLLSAELRIDKGDIWIEGVGSAMGQSAQATTIMRTAAAGGGSVIRISPPDSITLPLTTWPIIGGGISNVVLEANGLADQCLHLRTVHGGRYSDLVLSSPVAVGLYTDTLQTATLTSYNTTDSCIFERIFTYASPVGVLLSGNALAVGGHNTYSCTFYDLSMNIGAGVGVRYQDVDDIFLYSFSSSGTGIAHEFMASNGHQNARNVHLFGGFGLTGAQTIVARATGFIFPARDITFHGLSNEDGANKITIEPGAGVHYTNADGASTLFIDPATSCIIQDDFFGGRLTTGLIGALGWDIRGTGINYESGAANHPGCIKIATPATAGQSELLRLSFSGGNGAMWSGDGFDMTWIVRTDSNDSATTIRIGLGLDAESDPPADGIYFEKLAADTQWFGVCRDAGSQSRSGAMDTVGSYGWVRLRMKRINAARVGFTIGTITNGNFAQYVTTNVPAADLTPFVFLKTAAAASKSMVVDYFGMQVIGLTR